MPQVCDERTVFLSINSSGLLRFSPRSGRYDHETERLSDVVPKVDVVLETRGCHRPMGTRPMSPRELLGWPTHLPRPRRNNHAGLNQARALSALGRRRRWKQAPARAIIPPRRTFGLEIAARWICCQRAAICFQSGLNGYPRGFRFRSPRRRPTGQFPHAIHRYGTGVPSAST